MTFWLDVKNSFIYGCEHFNPPIDGLGIIITNNRQLGCLILTLGDLDECGVNATHHQNWGGSWAPKDHQRFCGVSIHSFTMHVPGLFLLLLAQGEHGWRACWRSSDGILCCQFCDWTAEVLADFAKKMRVPRVPGRGEPWLLRVVVLQSLRTQLSSNRGHTRGLSGILATIQAGDLGLGRWFRVSKLVHLVMLILGSTSASLGSDLLGGCIFQRGWRYQPPTSDSLDCRCKKNQKICRNTVAIVIGTYLCYQPVTRVQIQYQFHSVSTDSDWVLDFFTANRKASGQKTSGAATEISTGLENFRMAWQMLFTWAALCFESSDLQWYTLGFQLNL